MKLMVCHTLNIILCKADQWFQTYQCSGIPELKNDESSLHALAELVRGDASKGWATFGSFKLLGRICKIPERKM
jgi:hypothetical protein